MERWPGAGDEHVGIAVVPDRAHRLGWNYRVSESGEIVVGGPPCQGFNGLLLGKSGGTKTRKTRRGKRVRGKRVSLNCVNYRFYPHYPLRADPFRPSSLRDRAGLRLGGGAGAAQDLRVVRRPDTPRSAWLQEGVHDLKRPANSAARQVLRVQARNTALQAGGHSRRVPE